MYPYLSTPSEKFGRCAYLIKSIFYLPTGLLKIIHIQNNNIKTNSNNPPQHGLSYPQAALYSG